MRREEVSIPTADRRAMPAYYVRPEGEAARPGILIIHEIFGLTPEIRAVAERMAERGYAALVPDLYHRGGAKVLCIARALTALRRGQGDAFGDLESARTWLAGQAEVDGEKLGVMGFCMGGGFAILLAARGPFEAAGVWYGEVPRQLDAVRGICPTVASYGALDRPLVGQGERPEAFLSALGVDHDVRTYESVGHAFAFPPAASTLVMGLSKLAGMNVRYDPDVAADAWLRVDQFFAEHLGGGAAS